MPEAGSAGYARRCVADYSLADVARIFDLSPARLRYWQRTELIPASPGDASQPAFGFHDLVCIRAVIALLERGVPVRRIRRSVASIRERLPEIERPLDSLRVWVDGSDRVVVRHEGTLDGARRPAGARPRARSRRSARTCCPCARPARPRRSATPSRPSSGSRSAAASTRIPRARRRRWTPTGARSSAIPTSPTLTATSAPSTSSAASAPAARSCYEAAVGADPLHVEARFNLAGLLEEEGRDEAALVHYRAAARSDPTFPDAQLNLALLYDRLGLGRRAREHWRRYLGLRPDGSWAELARKRLDD